GTAAGSGWFTLVCEVAASGTGGIWPTGAAPGAGDSELVSPEGVLVVPLSQAPTATPLVLSAFAFPAAHWSEIILAPATSKDAVPELVWLELGAGPCPVT